MGLFGLFFLGFFLANPRHLRQFFVGAVSGTRNGHCLSGFSFTINLFLHHSLSLSNYICVCNMASTNNKDKGDEKKKKEKKKKTQTMTNRQQKNKKTKKQNKNIKQKNKQRTPSKKPNKRKKEKTPNTRFFQAFVSRMGRDFPGAFSGLAPHPPGGLRPPVPPVAPKRGSGEAPNGRGYKLEVTESHQKTKAPAISPPERHLWLLFFVLGKVTTLRSSILKALCVDVCCIFLGFHWLKEFFLFKTSFFFIHFKHYVFVCY